jgi:alpha-L-rhamnosidase
MQRREFLQHTATAIAGTMLIPSTFESVYASNLRRKALNKPPSAKFIWYEDQGLGRNLYGLFRRNIEIKGNIESATLNLFAESCYQLFINGKFVEFGPVRFDPRFPQYDNHDISKYLINGHNTIAVRVNYFGSKTYKAISNSAGLVAWGSVKTKNGSISLDSSSSTWKSISSASFKHYAPKMSFALNPVEIYSQSTEEEKWTLADFNDSSWKKAVELKNQELWGSFSKRSIPYMSGKAIEIEKVIKVVPLKQQEDWYSFEVPLPEFFSDDANKYSNFIAFSTWIYSETEQLVDVGVFWGETWLNGIEITRGVDSLDTNMRVTQQWNLKKGWNFYFGKVGGYFDIVQQYIAFPKGIGVRLSADKNLNSGNIFRHSKPLSRETFNLYLKNKPLPFAAEDNLEEAGGWVYVKNDEPAQSPCRETSWDHYGEILEKLSTKHLNQHLFSKILYPEGFALLMDAGKMNLAFPCIKLKGVKDATVDITFSDKLTPDNSHLFFNFNYLGGDRILCKEDEIEWMPQQPRGMRYIMLTVRHATNDVELTSFALRSASYPVENKGSFKCSDPLLTNIWELCQRTQSTNMEDAYDDCVSRERGMYIRDTIIQYHNNLAAFGDQLLMRRCLELYGQSPDSTGKFRAVYPNTGDYTISDFALNAMEGFLAYYEQTGDEELISSYWKAIEGNMAWFNSLADEHPGLLLDSEWHLKRKIKANYGGFHGDLQVAKGLMDNTGLHCVFTCSYLLALKAEAKLAIALGKTTEAASMQARIDKLTKSIPEYFWDADKECFADNDKHTTHSAHANLFAIRANVVEESKMPLVKNYIRTSMKSVFLNGYDPSAGCIMSPNFAFYLFDGLYKAGMADVAECLIKQGWGWMLAQGLKTCPEYFSTEPSLCHAWSASPMFYLSKNILGVQFTDAPDLSKVEIKVQTTDLAFAEGTFPHPLGVIAVKWHTERGKRIFDYVKVPEGVKYTIYE